MFAWTNDSRYHKPCNTADRVDSANMPKIARLAGDTPLGLAKTTADLAGGVKRGKNVCGSRGKR